MPDHESLDLRPLTMDEQMNEDTIYLPGLTMEQREKRIILAAISQKLVAYKALLEARYVARERLRRPGAWTTGNTLVHATHPRRDEPADAETP